ncbi:uncharacterized protein LOC115876469 [Sitophilus oryzae]|uniref:Uncharacterized protein LOC115876469 n=1 Tax=Sitophilus oryzae TaxID=7048 RepID=A0A6J2XA62_SITOR|nr:uncharacterized protein LOC115876469 [Sitophilus oryzae]
MNIVIFLYSGTLCLLLIRRSSGQSSNNHNHNNTKLDVFFKDCKEKSGVGEKDYERIKMRKLPESDEGICMVECLFAKLHIIENDKFNKRGFVLIFTPAFAGNIKQLRKLRELGDVCDKEIYPDKDNECSLTGQILNCLGRNKDLLNSVKRS